MKIQCNGKDTIIDEGVSIEKLLLELALNPDTVVVECNERIILREDYGSHILVEGDELELIRFVGGG
ncbi:MAG: sulfur carrier protein ThiS [Proteobacteria bacterium]|nr:sulfur carrier protein ThiS [Pseudomonadota bacterium]MBU1738310.1 sulfur carrier protein ThiS [Pseudomonadota bacterium]